MSAEGCPQVFGQAMPRSSQGLSQIHGYLLTRGDSGKCSPRVIVGNVLGLCVCVCVRVCLEYSGQPLVFQRKGKTNMLRVTLFEFGTPKGCAAARNTDFDLRHPLGLHASSGLCTSQSQCPSQGLSQNPGYNLTWC